MSRYRKIDTRTYGDTKFKSLSKPQPCGQYLWLWLLTGPGTCIIPGVTYNIGPAGIAELIGWPMEGFQKAFKEVIDQGMIKVDFAAPLIFIPNAIKYNPPQSPNVIAGWRVAWEEIPECPLKATVLHTLRDFCKGFERSLSGSL